MKKAICDSNPYFGWINVCYFVTLYIHKIAEDYVYFHAEFGDPDKKSYHRAKVYTRNNGSEYFKFGKMRINFDEIFRR